MAHEGPFPEGAGLSSFVVSVALVVRVPRGLRVGDVITDEAIHVGRVEDGSHVTRSGNGASFAIWQCGCENFHHLPCGDWRCLARQKKRGS